MNAADALRDFITPLLVGWRVQFGRWVDGTKTDRYAVIRPAGGLPAELVREPQFTLTLIGGLSDAADVTGAAADAVIEAMRGSSGTLVFMQPGEPALSFSSDGRAISEFPVSAITT